MCYNTRTGRICTIGQAIKQLFDDSSLEVLNIRLAPMENDIHRLEIVLGDKKTLREWDTIYMGLKVISTHKWFDYQICSSFYNKNPKENGYYLEPKLAPDAFFSRISFLAKLRDSEFIKELENEVNNYHAYCKRKEI